MREVSHHRVAATRLSTFNRRKMSDVLSDCSLGDLELSGDLSVGGSVATSARTARWRGLVSQRLSTDGNRCRISAPADA